MSMLDSLFAYVGSFWPQVPAPVPVPVSLAASVDAIGRDAIAASAEMEEVDTSSDALLAQMMHDQDAAESSASPARGRRKRTRSERGSPPEKTPKPPRSKRAREAARAPRPIASYPGIANPSRYCSVISTMHMMRDMNYFTALPRAGWPDDYQCIYDFNRAYAGQTGQGIRSLDLSAAIRRDIPCPIGEPMRDASELLIQINAACGGAFYFDTVEVEGPYVNFHSELYDPSKNDVVIHVNRNKVSARTGRYIKDSTTKLMPQIVPMDGENIFELTSVIHHTGRAGGGHFIIYETVAS